MSLPDLSTRLIAFSGEKCVAEGNPEQVVTYLKSLIEKQPESQLLVLNAVTSRIIELDFRDSPATILANQFRPAEEAAVAPASIGNSVEVQKRGRGRPKLGVVSREVTLMPRHWDWLSNQTGGASVALRRLVEQARHSNEGKDKRRAAQNSAYRFMTVLAGDAPGYEEAIRSLYADDMQGLLKNIASWPPDVAIHAELLARMAITGDKVKPADH